MGEGTGGQGNFLMEVVFELASKNYVEIKKVKGPGRGDI